MKEWFLTLSGEPFISFGTSHIIMLVIYFILVFLILYFHRIIKDNKPIFQILRWFLFILLIGSEITYQLWTATHGIWKENLPFHLCGIASLTGAFALLTLNRKLIAITFFIGLIPAFAALITPELPYDFPNFRFFKFFIHHIAISITSLFLAITSNDNNTITLKSMIHTFLYLVVYAFLIGFIINPWLDANYLYLSHTPNANTPLDFLGRGFWYRINLGILCVIVFYIQYRCYQFFRVKSNSYKQTTE